MKKITRILFWVVVGLQSVVLVNVCFYWYKKESGNPKAGEVWRWVPRSKSNNPFEKDIYSSLKPYYDYKVLAVRNGYVLYVGLADNDTTSSTIGYFKVGATRISK